MIEFQHTAEWYRARLGHFTGSKIIDLLGKPRNKDAQFSDTALSYIFDKKGERLLNKDFVNDDQALLEYMSRVNRPSFEMQWGSEWEGPAKLEYILTTHRQINETDFKPHKSIEWLGASPDGLILINGFDVEGVVEVKCPQPKNFARYCCLVHDNETLKKVQPQYYYQIQTELLVTGAQWCDFIVFHPFCTPKMRIVRIFPDTDAQSLIVDRVISANEFINEQIIKLRNNG